MARHRHTSAYAAVVLQGAYVEAGNRGRFAVEAGHVVLHGAYESHQDAFSHQGAMVLNLPFEVGCSALARASDPDAIARLAEKDITAACELLRQTMIPEDQRSDDWPDQLARCLSEDPNLYLTDWAAKYGLSPKSLSRGFSLAFGVTPKAFRAEQRALHAVRALAWWHGTLAALAAELGFADQAHMTRSVKAVTGTCPARLKAEWVQEKKYAMR